jgi:hypothetical protein
MGKRGPKPQGRVNLNWNSLLAYAVGLLAADGSLSKDGRHVDLTSKDLIQIKNFQDCLELHDLTIGNKKSSGGLCYRIQVSDILFYEFLLGLGLTPAKSKTLNSLKIPNKYFFDYLRGEFDGDGCFYSYWDRRWKNSFMFYTSFVSASPEHLDWLRSKLKENLDVNGQLDKPSSNRVWQLKFAKKESLKILKKMYPNKNVVCLPRKRLKVEQALGIVGERL